MTTAFSGTTTLYIESDIDTERPEESAEIVPSHGMADAPIGVMPHLPSEPIRPVVVAKPIVVPTITQTSVGVLSPNPVVVINRPIGPGWPWQLPMPRSRFSLPTLISPVAAPNSTTQFEEPQDGTKKHYLQQYAIATEGTAAQPLFWVSLAPTAPDFNLTVHLSATPLPGIPVGATVIAPTTVSYFLSATVLGRVVTWDFTASNTGAGALTLTTLVTGKAARDTLYHAMTDPAAGAQLVVRSAFAVASPVPPAAPANPPQPPMYRLGPASVDLSIAFTFDPVLNPNIFSQITSVGAAGPSTWSHQEIVWEQHSYSYYFDPADTSHVFYLPDSFKVCRQADAPHPPSLQITAGGSDPSLQSFVLSFQALPVTGLARLQDAIGKLTGQYGFPSGLQVAPFEASKTSLALTLPSADGSSAPGLQPVAGATIDIGAGISGAVTLSPQQLQQVYSALFDDVSALLSGVVTATINPTDASAPTIPFTARANNLAGDLFTIATSGFPGLLNAAVVNAIESPIHITGMPLALQRNGVTVAAAGHQTSPLPPFDLAVGGTAPAPDGGVSGGGTSPTNLGGVIGGIIGGVIGDGSGNGGSTGTQGGGGDGSTGTQVGGLLGGIFGGIGKDPTNPAPAPPSADPMQTAPTAPPVPAQSISVIFNLPQGGQASDTWTVLPDYSQAQVLPDQSAIWDAIMSNQVLSPFKRSVSVLVLSSLFQPPVAPVTSTDPTAPPPVVPSTIVAAQVVFGTGETANFTSATPAPGGVMTQTVSLSVPLKDYILQTGDTASYRYRVDLITATGTITGQWVTSNQDSFFVQANR